MHNKRVFTVLVCCWLFVENEIGRMSRSKDKKFNERTPQNVGLQETHTVNSRKRRVATQSWILVAGSRLGSTNSQIMNIFTVRGLSINTRNELIVCHNISYSRRSLKNYGVVR
jgi:hypothetical protein